MPVNHIHIHRYMTRRKWVDTEICKKFDVVFNNALQNYFQHFIQIGICTKSWLYSAHFVEFLYPPYEEFHIVMSNFSAVHCCSIHFFATSILMMYDIRIESQISRHIFLSSLEYSQIRFLEFFELFEKLLKPYNISLIKYKFK